MSLPRHGTPTPRSAATGSATSSSRWSETGCAGRSPPWLGPGHVPDCGGGFVCGPVSGQIRSDLAPEAQLRRALCSTWTAAARCWPSTRAVAGRRRYGPRLGGGDPDLIDWMVVTANYTASSSYGYTTVVVIKRSLGGVISPDPVLTSAVRYKLWTTA